MDVKVYKLEGWKLRLYQNTSDAPGRVRWYLFGAGWEEPAAEGVADSVADAIAAARAILARVLDSLNAIQL
jgi:hypothetical protein